MSNKMHLINDIIHYWLDCIRREDALGKDVSLNIGSSAILCPFTSDPFIFSRQSSVTIADQKIMEFFSKTKAQNNDVFFGYPLLLYFEERTQKHCVAPMFLIKVEHALEDIRLRLIPGDPLPSCGNMALAKIGLKTEEIAAVEKDIDQIFKEALTNPAADAKKCLDVISKEASFPINELIDPTSFTNNQPIPQNGASGLYNKGILFAGESTPFNMGLIKDLNALKSKEDIEQTALSFFTDTLGDAPNRQGSKNTPPLLPFPLSDYQISALTQVLKSKLSVITGPPGTGKSQFIMNLLVNIFFSGRTALFVSHTNEAVHVVNSKLNAELRNLLFRTGSKDQRQQLTERFNELTFDFQNQKNSAAPSLSVSQFIWKEITENRKLYARVDNLEKSLAEIIEIKKIKTSIFIKLKEWFFSWRLKRLPTKVAIEKRNGELREKYFATSLSYVKGTFPRLVFKNWQISQKAKRFLSQIRTKRSDEPTDDDVFDDISNALPIWSSTLKSINSSFPLKAGLFDFVIFDEASQVDLPSAAPALYRARNAVVVGDPMQLSHIAGITKEVDRALAKSHGLFRHQNIYPERTRYCDVSLYQAAELCSGSPPTLLAKHYRSHDQIADLCNQIFYGGQLTISSLEPKDPLPNGLIAGVQWSHVDGETTRPSKGSRLNIQEAEEVSRVFFDILSRIKDSKLSIGVVTPYSAQQRKLESLILNRLDDKTIERHDVKILTAHKFQGSEKDIMIFSLVISSKGEGNSDSWYNNNPQIMNVALSRAKRLLHIVGDINYCAARSGVLNKFVTTYRALKQKEDLEKNYFSGNFDSPYELSLYEKLQAIDFQKHGYRLVPKYNVRRYTLDFALVGEKTIDIECDGFGNHNIIDGLPVLEDLERDDFLRQLGWIVLRFPNYRIMQDPEQCISEVLRAAGLQGLTGLTVPVLKGTGFIGRISNS